METKQQNDKMSRADHAFVAMGLNAGMAASFLMMDVLSGFQLPIFLLGGIINGLLSVWGYKRAKEFKAQGK